MSRTVKPSRCIRGHQYIPKNTYIKPNGAYNCKKCLRQGERKYYASHHEQAVKKNNKSRFGGLREIVIQRDGEKCIECRMTRQEHKIKYGRDITVDHIDLMGRYKARELKNNALTNLQTMCLSCHLRKDAKLRKELKSSHAN